MTFKPMPFKIFKNYIKVAGWTLSKGSIDHNLYDDQGDFACSIKITHGKNTKPNEIPALCVKKAENEFKKRGLTWPPRKK